VFYRYKNRAMSEKPSADLGANWILRRGPRRPLSAATKLTVLLLLMLGNHRGTVEACMLSLSVHEQSLSSQSKAGSSACVVPFLAVTTASKTLVTPIDSFFKLPEQPFKGYAFTSFFTHCVEKNNKAFRSRSAICGFHFFASWFSSEFFAATACVILSARR
jgi:hypothetical protein